MDAGFEATFHRSAEVWAVSGADLDANALPALVMVALMGLAKLRLKGADALELCSGRVDFTVSVLKAVASRGGLLCGHAHLILAEKLDDRLLLATKVHELLARLARGAHDANGRRRPVVGQHARVVEAYTRVLQGHIAVDTAVWPEGTPGCAIDAFARRALWAAGMDYAHGTGHGVGAALNVHEGPQGIAPRFGNTQPLLEGMVLSNEPGYGEAGPPLSRILKNLRNLCPQVLRARPVRRAAREPARRRARARRARRGLLVALRVGCQGSSE